jgi:hypothetical protein
MRDLVAAFVAVGTSRPVEVTPGQEDELVELILEMGASEDLPDGIREFSDELAESP